MGAHTDGSAAEGSKSTQLARAVSRRAACWLTGTPTSRSCETTRLAASAHLEQVRDLGADHEDSGRLEDGARRADRGDQAIAKGHGDAV